jgi:methylated-DNA-protein-cysteine methyltransferase-like protein
MVADVDSSAGCKAHRTARIYTTICDIPRGSVASYGQVAEITGLPRGARQVAYALRHAPAELDVPWHRVVRSSGHIAFPAGSRGWRRQKKQLQEEGVTVTNGRVDMRQFRWQPELDELLWKPSAAWDDA